METKSAELCGLKAILQKIDILLDCSNAELQCLQNVIDDHVFDTFSIANHTGELIVAETPSRPKVTLFQGVIDTSTVNDQVWGFELADYCIGVSLGRWDIRFTTGEKSEPKLPAPFAPLPVCPPGQLQNEQGLPIAKEDVERLKEEGQWNYPIDIPWDGILVDDPGHPLDIEARIHQVLQVIWKDRWEAIEHKACEILGVKSLRDYFRKPSGFFADHLKRYSKSRRQAPSTGHSLPALAATRSGSIITG
ncbi:MAG: hypothetical protein AB1671_25440 [Thermodesulfobacteriota bacterium]